MSASRSGTRTSGVRLNGNVVMTEGEKRLPGGGTDLAVAVASQLRDEPHVILTYLNHLLTDVILWTAACRCARPPETHTHTNQLIQTKTHPLFCLHRKFASNLIKCLLLLLSFV